MTPSATEAPLPPATSLKPIGPGPWTIATAGAVALAVAMGIGRFAFTPLLPMMLHDGTLDLPTASWLASANYLGYLVGALLCMLQPWLTRRLSFWPAAGPAGMLRAGLAATCVLTASMALPWPAAWPALRFAAGVASAYVFVYTSGWCLAQLARRERATMGGAIYVGPGAGIVASGLVAGLVVAAQGNATVGWLTFSGLAVLLCALVWPVFRDDQPAAPMPASARPTGATSAADAAPMASSGQVGLLTLAYGFAGFGYIITATFLPVIARQALPGSAWLDLFWPIFGVGVMMGALLATRIPLSTDLRYLLGGCYLMQTVGVASSLVSPTPAGFVLGSVLLGLPFTAITYFAMQEVRRLRPLEAASTMGLATAVYGIGQIVGPPLVALLIRVSGSPARGFHLSLIVAAGALLSGAMLYLVMRQLYPRPPPSR